MSDVSVCLISVRLGSCKLIFQSLPRCKALANYPAGDFHSITLQICLAHAPAFSSEQALITIFFPDLASYSHGIHTNTLLKIPALLLVNCFKQCCQGRGKRWLICG